MKLETAGWRRLSKKWGKTWLHLIHDESGWELRHCGHPTANWPYYMTDPRWPERAVMTHNGLGFRKLEDAINAHAMVMTGQWIATNYRCGPSTRRIITNNSQWNSGYEPERRSSDVATRNSQGKR